MPLNSQVIARSCPNLEKLRVDHGSTDLEESTLPELAQACPQLRQLGVVGHWTLRSNLLLNFAKFRNLRCINISRCTHVEMAPLVELIRSLRELELLDCSDVDVSDAVLVALAEKHAATLKGLYFSGYFTKDAGLAALGMNCTPCPCPSILLDSPILGPIPYLFGEKSLFENGWYRLYSLKIFKTLQFLFQGICHRISF